MRMINTAKETYRGYGLSTGRLWSGNWRYAVDLPLDYLSWHRGWEFHTYKEARAAACNAIDIWIKRGVGSGNPQVDARVERIG